MARSRPRQDAGRILSRLAPFLDERGALRELRGTLSRAPERLARPVRLAVVGQIKRGKSTLVNAMIGKQLAATGQLETTFRINEFKAA
jgi:predicted GTPase